VVSRWWLVVTMGGGWWVVVDGTHRETGLDFDVGLLPRPLGGGDAEAGSLVVVLVVGGGVPRRDQVLAAERALGAVDLEPLPPAAMVEGAVERSGAATRVEQDRGEVHDHATLCVEFNSIQFTVQMR
jgi:hypothetical protein